MVTGIIKNIPGQSSLQFEMAVLYENITYSGKPNWNNFSPRTFIKLHPGVSVEDINRKIADFIPKHKKDLDVGLSVLRFSKRYTFFSGVRKYILIFSLIAFFILIIACINFINLSTARSVNRAREISIRKITGAHRKNIILQFMGESLVMSFIAFVFALILTTSLLPVFNTLTGKEMVFNYATLFPISIGLMFFTGLIAGSYPALFLSSFQPVKGLKGNLKSGSKGFVMRKTLVVIQFAISIFLIIGTGIVYRQLHFIKTKNMGYEKEQIIKISMKGESKKKYNLVKNELLHDQRILAVTGMMDDLPDFGWDTGGIDWEGKDPDKKVLTSFNYIDYGFIETLNINMVEGRDFSQEFASDVGKNYLVNQEMVKLMGLDSAVGVRLTLWGKPGVIIGVMKNFHFQPLYNQISPLVLLLYPKELDNVLIKISSENIARSIKFIKKTWEKILPLYPFEYRFLYEDFHIRYRESERIGKLVNIFSILAIFIASLGLFGLASFTTEQRSKEIGVRKVLGASVSGIVILLSKEFTRWVLLANIIAWPVAWMVMNNWLRNFAYKTSMEIWIFILAGFTALVIAICTVCVHTIKAAMANPVKTLRYE